MTRLLLLVAGYGGGILLTWRGDWRHGLALFAVTGAIHFAAVVLYPWHRCWACRGRGVFWLGRNHGDCVVCGNRRRYPRTGARILTPGRARRMTQRRRGR
jgi:hypothetical protein